MKKQFDDLMEAAPEFADFEEYDRTKSHKNRFFSPARPSGKSKMKSGDKLSNTEKNGEIG